MTFSLRFLFLLILAAVGTSCSLTQSLTLQERYEAIGRIVELHLATAPFPHPARANGHTYDGKTYSAEEHYSDSTVGVFIPDQFQAGKPFDIVVHIHGWGNNVDSVFAQFDLALQVARSGRNIILVVPQGPKNAPDSFGGRLEETGAFKAFIDDIVRDLENRKIIEENAEPGIILSGHSGAYRMISFILARGGMTEHIKEVYLFDAIYGQLEKYAYWLDHYKGRFIAIYTDGGGTKGTTESLMEDLAAWGIDFGMMEESSVSDSDLSKNRIFFIHTDLSHNEVIDQRGQLERYLRTGSGNK